MDANVIALLVMVSVMSVLIVAVGVALVFMPSITVTSSTMQSTTSYTSSSSTSSTTLMDTTLLESSTTSTTSTTSSSTLPAMKQLQVSYIPAGVYRGDYVKVSVSSNGVVVDDAFVLLDGSYLGNTESGVFTIPEFKSGIHELVVVKEGFQNNTGIINASTVPYTSSSEVYRLLSPADRARYLSNGWVNVRYYYTVNCPQCAIVEPKLNAIIQKNRGCVLYEKINILRYREQLIGKFGSSVKTPYLEVQGPRGTYSSSGLVPTHWMEEKILGVTECGVVS
ncbi:MAG: hypothetical protein ABIH11_05395 [Candidatus Altiarchaeota archaeon]